MTTGVPGSAGERVQLLRDLDRETGWLLMVDGSEQSYVDVAEPAHLEFEYVQHMAAVIETAFAAGRRLTAVHLGGGLCTVPRWLADRHPGSCQLVIERSEQIAAMARSLPLPDDVELRVGEVATWLAGTPAAELADVCVLDVYDGPDTVTAPFALDSLQPLADRLRRDGRLVANLSDAAPFDFARSAAAALGVLWDHVVVVAEPPVLRGRRSGNLVLTASQRPLDLPALARRCAAAPARGRVLAEEELTRWIGTATPAVVADGVPRSGERGVRWLR